MKLEAVRLKNSPFDEAWVQQQIADDPSLLGLGDLVLRDKERIQPKAGRLDLLLQNPETLKRYEVEIQLGATDESHIIRTIEYWDIERKRYPQYEHAAVIVAEDVTSRFLNVIQLFNGAIPLIALKMTAYKIGDDYALTFVKVVDEVVYGLVDDDEDVYEPASRQTWEEYSPSSLNLSDYLFDFVKQVEPQSTMNYTQSYIGTAVDGSACNFVYLLPRQRHVIFHVRLDRNDDTDREIDEAGFDLLNYDSHFNYYRLKIADKLGPVQEEALKKLIQSAKVRYFG